MGPGGRGLGTHFSFRWNNQVAWITVCETLNAGLPPKKHLRDLTHRERVALFFLIVLNIVALVFALVQVVEQSGSRLPLQCGSRLQEAIERCSAGCSTCTSWFMNASSSSEES